MLNAPLTRRRGGGTKCLRMVDFFTGSLEKWENRECLKLNRKGKGEAEKQGKVNENAITFQSRVCLLFPCFILREVLMLAFSCCV